MSGISAIGGGGASSLWIQAQYAINTAQAQTAVAGATRAELPVEPVTPVRALPSDVPVQIPVAVRALPDAAALNDPAEILARMKINYPSGEAFDPEAFWNANAEAGEKSKTAAEAMEEGECETCKRRKYQDGSDDPGVSFKTPTNIDPRVAAGAVRGHEQEHVTRERAAAEREGREVVRQSVTIKTDICPECGRVYVSGGETETVTAEKTGEKDFTEIGPAEPEAA